MVNNKESNLSRYRKKNDERRFQDKLIMGGGKGIDSKIYRNAAFFGTFFPVIRISSKATNLDVGVECINITYPFWLSAANQHTGLDGSDITKKTDRRVDQPFIVQKLKTEN